MIPGFNGKPVNEWGVENNIWVIRNGMYKSSKDIVAFEHPAIFPEELALKHIISWTLENDLIYDPFMGSGTTAKCSIQLKRNWIGSEIDNNYFELINKRMLNVSNEMIDTFITRNDINKNK